MNRGQLAAWVASIIGGEHYVQGMLGAAALGRIKMRELEAEGKNVSKVVDEEIERWKKES